MLVSKTHKMHIYQVYFDMSKGQTHLINIFNADRFDHHTSIHGIYIF